MRAVAAFVHEAVRKELDVVSALRRTHRGGTESGGRTSLRGGGKLLWEGFLPGLRVYLASQRVPSRCS